MLPWHVASNDVLTPQDSRVVVVSNRLPIIVRGAGDTIELADAAGGLATGMRPLHEVSRGAWIGWPGDVSRLTEAQRRELDVQLQARGIVAVHLSRDHVERYYAGFSNRVIWPLFHYQLDRIPVDATGWDAYAEVNAAFADAIVREYRSGDRIWIHDYQLMLVPQLVRERLPHAAIGFFLHIPFPSSEVFRSLPWRQELLKGMLGADLLGFHTYAYMRHFIASLLHVCGIEADIDRVRLGDRDVSLGVFPMGIDAARFGALAEEPEVLSQLAEIKRAAGGRQIVLGVDRLDYTKGIPRRLRAIEQLLHRHPALADQIRYVQVAVPSRGEVDAYQRFRRHVEEAVGRINGLCGTLSSTPVHYIYRSVSAHELAALYRAADVMLVTPLRDGMNLVAKEFVASRIDEDGVLVLSEFAGAAAELDSAVSVNPYDVDAVAHQLHRSLAMPLAERRARMRALRKRVLGYDVHAWAQDFLASLRTAVPDGGAAPRIQPPLFTALAEARAAGQLRLLLDYDGTLVPLARSPELAAPDDELLAILTELSACPDFDVEIVSGRPTASLEQWLGHLPIPLWAEHGFWRRLPGQTAWQPIAQIDPKWSARVLPILQRFTSSTPGSRLEVKSASLAWHFRGAQHGFGARQAHELRMLLGDALSNQPLEVLEGHKVVEVRVRGISKAVVADPGHVPHVGTIVAIGDDRTDEDLFGALPAGSVTIAVSQPLNGARYVLPGYQAVRQLLRGLLTDRRPEALPPAPEISGAPGA
jgi:trehalose 6-phosphate synthase/phosphatase